MTETVKAESGSKDRGNILLDAHEIINGERQDLYGAPEDSFQAIAEFWHTYLKYARTEHGLQPHDVEIMMTLFKIARITGQKHHEDNFTDAAGYIGIACDLKAKEEGK